MSEPEGDKRWTMAELHGMIYGAMSVGEARLD